MTGDYLCRFYIKGRVNEEIVFASSAFQAKRLIEAKYARVAGFRWSSLPNLAKNSNSWF